MVWNQMPNQCCAGAEVMCSVAHEKREFTASHAPGSCKTKRYAGSKNGDYPNPKLNFISVDRFKNLADFSMIQ